MCNKRIRSSCNNVLDYLYPISTGDITSTKQSIAKNTRKFHEIYRKISNISRTKFPNLNVSHLVLQLSLPNPFKPSVKWIMKM